MTPDDIVVASFLSADAFCPICSLHYCHYSYNVKKHFIALCICILGAMGAFTVVKAQVIQRIEEERKPSIFL